MGNYREQYEKYYKDIKTNSGAAAYKRASTYQASNLKRENNKKKNIFEGIVKKLIWQLSISLALLVVVFTLKYIPTEGKGDEFYELSKDVISNDLNFSGAVSNIDIPEVEEYREKFLDYIDEVKASVSGERTLKELIKEDYVEPVSGKIKYINGESKGVAISTEDKEEVVSVYGGTIEKVNDDADGKCVIINHGNGTETYYESLSEVEVEEGDVITKGEIVGKCGNIDTTGKKGVIFKFMYLGNEKNPSDVMDLSSLEEV